MNRSQQVGTGAGIILAGFTAFGMLAASHPDPSGTGVVWVQNGVEQPIALPFDSGLFSGSGPLGVTCTSAYCAGEQITEWQWVDAGSTGTLFTLTPFVSINVGTTVHIVSDIPTQLIGNPNYNSNGYSRYMWFGIANPLSDGGILFTDFVGGGASAIDSKYGSNLGSATPSIGQCGNSLCVTLACGSNCAGASSNSYNTWPLDTFDSGIIDAGPPPTLTALSSPLLMTASGGGQPVTISGTNLTPGSTTISVCGAFASSVTATSTTVQFTWPTGIAEDQSCTIVATTPAGSATLSNGGCSTCAAVYSLSPNITNIWYAAEFYNSGTQTWTDLVAGATATPPGGGTTVPTYSAAWSNSQPGFIESSQQGFANTTITITQPDSIFMFGNDTSSSGNTYYFDGNGSGRQLLRDDFGLLEIYAGTFFSNILSNTSPAWVECDFNGSSSAILVNNVSGTPSSGNAGVITLTPGINIGYGNAGAASITGGYGIILIYEGTPTAGEQSFMNAIFNLIY